MKFEEQFELDKSYYLEHMDFKDWLRYFYVIKDIQDINPANILECGTGNDVVKNIIKPTVDKYVTLDLNEKLKPDIIGNIITRYTGMINHFDCVIACEILEHINYALLEGTLENLVSYLKPDGKIIFTLPHKRPYCSISTILNVNPVHFYLPKFRHRGNVDSCHKWEIGSGISKQDINTIIENINCKIIKYRDIPYHGYWIIEKENRTS